MIKNQVRFSVLLVIKITAEVADEFNKMKSKLGNRCIYYIAKKGTKFSLEYNLVSRKPTIVAAQVNSILSLI